MGCGASAGSRYKTDSHAWAEQKLHQPSARQEKQISDLTVGTGAGQLSPKAGNQVVPPQLGAARGAPRSYRCANQQQPSSDSCLSIGGAVRHGQNTEISYSSSATPQESALQHQSPQLDAESGTWEVQEFDGSRGGLDSPGSMQHAHTGHTEEVFDAYNFFFEHIGLRKGWRTAPFRREDVQAPFWAAAEVVVDVRAWLDARRGAGTGVVLRQVEGSAMNFLWGWNPDKPPASSEDFFRGLVFATLSDGNGLVEGLQPSLVESYVSHHPFIGRVTTVCEDACALEAATDACADTTPAVACN